MLPVMIKVYFISSVEDFWIQFNKYNFQKKFKGHMWKSWPACFSPGQWFGHPCCAVAQQDGEVNMFQQSPIKNRKSWTKVVHDYLRQLAFLLTWIFKKLHRWKSFSWVFKRGLIYFSLNNFSRFQIFLAFIILSCYS